MAEPNKYLSKAFIDGVYIPSGLLVFGVLIVKKEWLPFAVALAAILGGYKIWSTRLLPFLSLFLHSSPLMLIELYRYPSRSKTHCIPRIRAEGENHHFA